MGTLGQSGAGGTGLVLLLSKECRAANPLWEAGHVCKKHVRNAQSEGFFLFFEMVGWCFKYMPVWKTTRL